MPTQYCPKCGGGTEYKYTKPQFCSCCGQGYNVSFASPTPSNLGHNPNQPYTGNPYSITPSFYGNPPQTYSTFSKHLAQKELQQSMAEKFIDPNGGGGSNVRTFLAEDIVNNPSVLQGSSSRARGPSSSEIEQILAGWRKPRANSNTIEE